jgi:hypothetical protein
MGMKTMADIRAETHDRLSTQLAHMTRALLRARGETDWTVRIITHAVEQCAATIGDGYFDNSINCDKAVDAAIYRVLEGEA